VPPSSTPPSRPGRYLGALLALLIVLLVSVLGGNILKPADWHKSFVVGRGLDLSSGTQVTLQAIPAATKNGQRPAAPTQAEMTKAVQIITNRVEATGLTGATVVQQHTTQIVVSVPGAGASKVATLVGRTALLRLREVLLEAPNYVTRSATPPPTPSPSPSSQSKVAPKSSASPAPSGSAASASASAAPSSGSGQAAGASKLGAAAAASPTPKASAAASTSPSPAVSPSVSASPPPAGKPVLATAADGSGDAAALTPATVKLFNRLNCADKNWKSKIYGSGNGYDDPSAQTVACNGGIKYAMAPAVVQGTDLGNVQAQDQTSGWVVTFDVKQPAATALGKLTTTMVTDYYPSTQGTSGNPSDVALNSLAVVLDGELQGTPPQVTGAISTQGQINGGSAGFSQGQATQLADVLKYGSLPLSFKNLYTSSVSPQLGSDQLSAGLFAACVGLLLVVLYSFLYYRGLGLVSVSSLTIAALLSYLSVVLLSRYEGFTLSLAGVAGLIVAIGITADSFIVYFERLRDEVREGRSLRAAVERGWTRARRTILVSDTVSFLAALLLYILSVGDVRGFAFTLGLTTLIDVVVVFLFTKPMITLLARTKFYGQGHRFSGLDPARLGARAPFRASRRPATGTGGAAAESRTSTSTREA
jgi:preprotein translocase subunit SecD